MIFMYPMLTSTNVNPNIIPGICKVIEKFILLYSTDQILAEVRKIKKEGVDYSEDFLNLKEIGPGISPNKPSFFPIQTGKQEMEKGLKVIKPNRETLSLDPTWWQIEVDGIPVIIGIKVISFPVASPSNFASLLLDDKNKNLIKTWWTKHWRQTVRDFWSLCRGLKIPFLKNRALTGDPKKDILHGSTIHKDHVFALISQMDLNEEFIDEPKKIRRLFQMKWSTIIIADDINKKAMFCMPNFSGLCSAINYNFLFTSIGKEYGEIFKDLDDIKKSASPFFRLKVDPKKLIGENLASNKLQIYQNLLNEKEDFNKENLYKIYNELKIALGSKDYNKVEKTMNKIPIVKMSEIEKICNKESPSFRKSYDISKKVVKNSTNLDSNLVDRISCLVAFGSTYKQEKEKTKENLKKIIPIIRNEKDRNKMLINVLNMFDKDKFIISIGLLLFK